MGISSILIIVPILLFFEFSFEMPWMILGILVSAPRLITLIYYSKSVNSGDVSRALPIMKTSPIFVAVLAAIFLAERLSLINYAGIVLVVIGGLVMSIKNVRNFSWHAPVKYAILTAIVYSITLLIRKFILGNFDFISLFFWVSVGQFLFSFLLFSKKTTRTNTLKFFNLRKKYLLTYLVSQIIAKIGSLFNIMALSLGSASLIATVGAIQPLFVLLFATLISIFAPHIIKEDLAKENFLLKLMGILLIIFGTLFII